MIIFVRHGETVYNIQEKFQGISDSPLTEKGIQQAHAIGEYLSTICTSVDYIVSPLPRTLSTHTIIASYVPGTVKIEPLVREICYGAWEGVEKTTLVDKPQWKMRENNRFTFVHPGEYNGIRGESYEEHYNRLITLFNKLQKANRDKHIALITHNGTLIAAHKYFRSLSDTEAGTLKPKNNEVLIIENTIIKTMLV